MSSGNWRSSSAPAGPTTPTSATKTNPPSAIPRSRLRKDASELISSGDEGDGLRIWAAERSSSTGGPVRSYPAPSTSTVDPSKLFTVDTSINRDILVLIRGYLRRCGLHATATTLQNEANLQVMQAHTFQRQISQAVQAGDWEQLRELSKIAPVPRLRRAFLYLVNKQEFLELVASPKQDPVQIYNHLIRRLKPLEHQAKASGDDFRDLAYLGTCRSVTDSPAFRNWEGPVISRRRLVRELSAMVRRSDVLSDHVGEGVHDDEEEYHEKGSKGNEMLTEQMLLGLEDAEDDSEDENEDSDTDPIKRHRSNRPARLVTLLQQAYAFQVEQKLAQGALASLHALPRVNSLLVDFSAPILPDPRRSMVLAGHEQGVKCLEWIEERKLLASGSSDCDISVWDLSFSSPARRVLKGHTGRVWDLSSTREGDMLASVSADSTLRIWSLEDDSHLRSVPTGHVGDIYSVCFHPESRIHVVTTGHDQTVRLIDLERETVVRTFKAHTGSVVQAVFNPLGNLIVSGSKDATVRFFDVVSGVCVRTIPQLLGAVTSVAMNPAGDKLLTATKDSSNRLWDIRSGHVLGRFKGHVNSSKSFIRAGFGASDQIILSGSEDGAVHVWDADSGRVLDKLTGHSGSVFRAVWSTKWNLLGSCSDDGTVRVWEPRRNASANQLA